MGKTIRGTDPSIPTSFDSITVQNSSLLNNAITGTTINSSVIGGSVPAAGTFTTLTASSVSVGGGISFPDGSASLPSISFSSDTNTGFYRVGADAIGVSAGGTLRLTFNDTDITSTVPYYANAGAVGTPSITFSGDTDTGLFSSAADTIGFTTGGTARMLLSSTDLDLQGLFIDNLGGIRDVNNNELVQFSVAGAAVNELTFGNAGAGGAPSVSATGDETNIDISLAPKGTGTIDVNSSRIENLSNPTGNQDAATKIYVDNVAAGLDPKESCRCATTAILTGFTYNTGSPDNFTGITDVTIDGVSFVQGDRILVKNQGDSKQNGIYEVQATTSTWNRSSDMDGTPVNEVSGGNFTFIETGTANEGTGWVVTGDGVLTLNTDDIDWVQFSSAGGSGDVNGPGSSTDDAIARFNGATGKTIQNSGVTLNDSDVISGASAITSLAGSALSPTYSFSSDTNTGIYSGGADNLAFSTGGTQRLFIDGSTSVTSTLPIYLPDGTALSPTYTFSSDTNTGIYSGGADNLAFSTGGTQRLFIDGSTSVTSTLPIYASDGAVSTPSYTFSNDPDTGIYRFGANALGIAVGGSNGFRVTSSYVINELPILAQSGTAGAPGYSFEPDIDTGIFRVGSDTIGFSTGGSEAMRIDSSGRLLSAIGSSSVPSYSFTTDTDTGMYLSGIGVLQFTIGGTNRLTMSLADITSTLPIHLQSGSESAPALAFSSDTNTGLYSAGADILGISVAGENALILASGGVGVNEYTITNAASGSHPTISATGDNTNINVSLIPKGSGVIDVNSSLISNVSTPVSGTDAANRSYVLSQVGGGGKLKECTRAATVGSDLGATYASGGGAGGTGQFTSAPSVLDGVTLAQDDRVLVKDQTDAKENGIYSVTAVTTTWDRASDHDGASEITGGQLISVITGTVNGGTLWVIENDGDITINTDNINIGIPLNLAADGSVSAPAYSFTSQTNTGMFKPTSATLGFALAGTEYWRISVDGHLLSQNDSEFIGHGNNTPGSPAYRFSGVADAGMYYIGTNTIGFSTQGNEVLSLSSGGGGAVNYINITSGTGIPVIEAVGSANVPLDITSTGTGTLSLQVNSTDVLTIDSGVVTTLQPFHAADGLVSAPSYSFTSDTNTGMFKPTSTTLGFALAGTEYWRISVDGHLTSQNDSEFIGHGNNTPNDPAYRFSGDVNTGMYHIGTNILGFSAQGNEVLSLSSGGSGAVNYVDVISSLTLVGPTISSQGEANVPLNITTKGTDTLALQVNNTDVLTIDSDVVTSQQPIRVQTGSLDTPSYSFDSDPDTGFIGSADQIIVVGGGKRIIDLVGGTADVNAITISSSETLNVPSISTAVSSDDPHVGLILQVKGDADLIMGSSTNGNQWFLDGAKGNFVGEPINGGVIRVRDAAGDASTPAYSFNGDVDTGMYRISEDVIGFSTGTTEALRITSTQRTRSSINGTVGSPNYSFVNDPNTGMYHDGTNDVLRFSTGSTEALRLSSDQRIRSGVSGTAGSPNYSFTGDINTGIYHDGTADTLRISTGGTERANFNADGIFTLTHGSAAKTRYTSTAGPTVGLNETDKFVILNISTGSFTYNLPDSSEGRVDGREMWITHRGSGGNATVATTDGSGIDGPTTIFANDAVMYVYEETSNFWYAWVMN